MTPAFSQRVRLSSLSALLFALAACHLLQPYELAQNIEQRAGVVLGDFEIYQQASLSIGHNEEVPSDIRLHVVQAARKAKGPIDDLDTALRSFQKIRAALLAGEESEDKLRIVADNLETWIAEAKPLVDDLKKWVGKVRA